MFKAIYLIFPAIFLSTGIIINTVNPEDSEGQDKKLEDKDEGNADVRQEGVTVVSLINTTIVNNVSRIKPGLVLDWSYLDDFPEIIYSADEEYCYRNIET